MQTALHGARGRPGRASAHGRRSRWVLVLVLLVLAPATALAAPSRVVVLEPSAAEGELQEILTRVRAELLAEGFAVVRSAAPAGSSSRAALEQAAEQANAVAAISVRGTGNDANIDLWVTDRVTGKTLIRTVRVDDVPAAERPKTLAIRAVELLRASLLEAVYLDSTEEGDEPLPADLQRWLVPPESPLAGFGVQLGIALLHSFDAVGTSGAPFARLSFGHDSGLAARLSWVGPALGARAEGPLGTAAVRQELLVLELAYAPAVDWWGISPVLSVGAGPYHLYASGDITAPLAGQSDDVWAAAVVGGLGLGYRLTDDVMALGDVGLLFALPRAVVTMQGERIGTAGRPSLSSTLGVVARF